jgi:alanine-glyoxylate transaminase/(R)-3-amino-2-methylpropionate-pyruvate transaminase
MDATSSPALPVDWSTDGIIARREKYYAASQRAFVPYRKPLILKAGQGQYVWDELGNKLIDLLGMNLCISVGHAHPVVVQAIKEQVDLLTHCTTMFHHPVPAHLAEELAATMPRGHEWVVHFTNSGAEATDLAIMMARSKTGNADLLSLRGAYHGATYGAQSVSGMKNFRHHAGDLSNVSFVIGPNDYRGVFGPGADRYLAEIDNAINFTTSGNLAAMLIEPVQGYGGIIFMPDGYLRGAFERVRAAGGLCIVDEVQSGFGKTGDNMWGFQAHRVVPDIVIMAKGMGNGIPIGAVVAKRDVAESMSEKFLFHTYGGNPIACAAARAVLKVINEERLIENAHVVGAALKERLDSLIQKYEIIGDVRGRGLMLAIELVKDRKSKEPAVEETAIVFENTRKYGLVMSKSGPFRNVLRMVPPLRLSMDDVDPVADAFERSFRDLASR